jgi:alkanesulfonate monooxygenase SsuD/methylene tetrahydromethanopterin reductase-like flavin-dependent oxidoreductase (luciferase family)
MLNKLNIQGYCDKSRGPEEILRALERAEIPDDRLTLGLGSGSARSGQLALVRDGIARIREVRAPRIVVGALGPRMRRLAARDADGPLLTWLTPAVAAAQRDQARAARETTRTHLYVRTAFDAGAQDRMLREADRYASYPNYAANFARLGVDARDTVLPGPGADDVSAGLGEYLAAVDEVVLRAIVGEDDFAEYEAFVTEAAAARDSGL